MVNSFSGGFIFVVGWVFVQALQLAALSLALSHGREDGQLLGFSFTVMETNGAGCFFRRPFMGWIQAVCKRLLIFQLFLFVAVYTSLTACCPLSNSLPRERGRGCCWDEDFCKENKLCRLLFSCLALLLPLNHLHYFHKMRFQFGKQRIVFVFHHHFAHQLQPHGEALRHFGGEAFAFLHETDDVEDVVVVGRIKG